MSPGRPEAEDAAAGEAEGRPEDALWARRPRARLLASTDAGRCEACIFGRGCLNL